jgi:hypothetical protein
MHNHFREQLDSGLSLLAATQGKNGLPNGPAAAPRLVPQGWATGDGNAESLLMKQQQDADRAETEAQRLADGSVRNR